MLWNKIGGTCAPRSFRADYRECNRASLGVTQKRAGRHFGFLKRAGRHQKAAGRPALRKRPRQNTVTGYQIYCCCLLATNRKTSNWQGAYCQCSEEKSFYRSGTRTIEHRSMVRSIFRSTVNTTSTSFHSYPAQ